MTRASTGSARRSAARNSHQFRSVWSGASERLHRPHELARHRLLLTDLYSSQLNGARRLSGAFSGSSEATGASCLHQWVFTETHHSGVTFEHVRGSVLSANAYCRYERRLGRVEIVPASDTPGTTTKLILTFLRPNPSPIRMEGTLEDACPLGVFLKLQPQGSSASSEGEQYHLQHIMHFGPAAAEVPQFAVALAPALPPQILTGVISNDEVFVILC
jgi:hypothetical protein